MHDDEAGWRDRFCCQCEFAILRRSIVESETFECRFGPPARGRYTVYSPISDEAKYPIVTSFTPACSQFSRVNERQG
jgi:hypothetical protein